MKFTIFSTLALAATAMAAPSGWESWGNNKNCLTTDIANQIISEFGSLLTNFKTSTAQSLLSPTNFTDTSSSINFLAGAPIMGVTFPNQQAFIAGQGPLPPIGFKVDAVDAVTCNGIVFRWTATVGQSQKQLRGIDIFYASVAQGGDYSKVGTGGWQLNEVFSEFNSATWDQALGGTCNPPSH